MNDLPITEEQVRMLINSQFPQWTDLDIRFVENGGNDNRTFRLGDHMSVRLPSAEIYAVQIEKESIWLPILAPQLSIPITLPIVIGKPEFGYPCNWSVNKWLEGRPLQSDDSDKTQIAKDLAKFLKELHVIDCINGPKAGTHNFHRGGSLSMYNSEVTDSLQMLSAVIDINQYQLIWKTALSSEWENKPVWVHGDVAVGNLLHQSYSLSGVIDFGILGIGDPACDLVMAWTYFDNDSRKVFMQELNLDIDTWNRARGWALWKALITYESYSSKEVLRLLLKS